MLRSKFIEVESLSFIIILINKKKLCYNAKVKGEEPNLAREWQIYRISKDGRPYQYHALLASSLKLYATCCMCFFPSLSVSKCLQVQC